MCSSDLTNVGKAATTAKNWSKLGTQQQAVEQSKESLESIQQEQQELQEAFDQEVVKIAEQLSAETLELETTEVKPKKTDVVIKKVQVAWFPRRTP